MSAPRLNAAVLEPGSDAALSAARVTPENAERLMLGNCQLGYRHDPRRRPPWSLLSQRVSEIERLIELRYGGPCDCDDGWPYVCIVVNSLAHKILAANAGRRDPVAFVRRRLRLWAEVWTPRVGLNQVDRLIDQAVAEPRWYTADAAAKLLCLRMAERMDAGITTIGAVDADKATRAELRKQRHRDRQRARDAEERREAGAKPREQYEAASIAALCRKLKISRSTYYRRLRAGEPLPEAGPEPTAEAPCDRSPAQQYRETNVGAQTTCVTLNEGAGKGAQPSIVRVWTADQERVRWTFNLNERRADFHDAVKWALGIPLTTPWEELRDVTAAWNAIPIVSDNGPNRRDLIADLGNGQLTLINLAGALVRHGARQRFTIRQRLMLRVAA
jgi:sRNA-binding protein